MRPKISNKNVAYVIRGEYGFNSINQFFEHTEHHVMFREKVIRKVVQEFTHYHFHNDGKLTTFNPYTNAFESLKIENFNHVTSKEELLKELSTLHKARMAMLDKSRKKLVQLSKNKDRDKDLEPQVERRLGREAELQGIHTEKGKDQDHDREQ
ncbi:hypothetical protein [uncultured Dokdonia sp.]|mgnify:CR=1 FL=1|uniref:hypothetical protein n=1 Tax=uncultured Dokdonia sp. TaxID=575653 RepID=UPI002632D21F|nr:hypothetical protein [uncultured Dokdonia sp.]